MLTPSLIMKNSVNTVDLRFPLWFRMIFLVSGVLLTTLAAMDGFSHPFPLILLAVCLLSGLYEERWIYHKSTGFLEARMGLVILYRKHLYRNQVISAFNLRFVMRGSLSADPGQAKQIHTKPLIRLEAHLTDGQVLVIEVDKARNRTRLTLQGEALARAAGKPLHREL